MKAEIITIGDEILIGQTIDTNSAWLGEQLHLIGVKLNRIVTISDTPEAIRDSIDDSFNRADLILMTGGLGPTQDDVTKVTLVEFFGTTLERNQEVLDEIDSYFTAKGLQMLESNRKQADLPKDAKILRNTRGTAMGMWFEKNGKVLISMPGVPYEMKGIMQDHGLRMLQDFFPTKTILHQTIQTQGIGESFLAEIISDWETALRNDGVSLAYLPSPGLVKLRLTAYADSANKDEVSDKIAHYISELERRIPEYIFGREKDTVAKAVQDLFQSRGLTLAAAESCTGGLIAHEITSIPGSSAHFMGSMVTYSNQAKTIILGVKEESLEEYGAVSEQVVREMAEGVRQKLGSDYAIATSGVAGPDGGTEEKPVGTVWVSVAGPGKTLSKRLNLGKSRERNIRISMLSVLNWLRQEIISGTFE
ncbi:competence/damage-inducible protein A [Cryomorphaceae bacterium 1068]|nr:competence/damage-inducible protein A [Cryomorphaceae bacterium 1068]